jgi:hypothetical protein
LNLFVNLAKAAGQDEAIGLGLEPESGYRRRPWSNPRVEDGMINTRALSFSILISALAAGVAGPAMAQSCAKKGLDVSCDDGRRGIFTGDAIVWADGTRSSLASPHPSVIIGNKPSVVVGQGVFVGKGKGVVPMENPSDPRRARCPVLDGVSYCY